MKLTSKRLLQSIVASASLAALPSFAQNYWVTNDFEGQTVGASIEDGSVWFSTNVSGEAVTGYGTVTNRDTYGWDTDNTSGMPMAKFTSENTKVLVLSTDGGTLYRQINGETGIDLTTSGVWVDTMIKFVKSDDAPTLASGYKMAFYVNGNSNLVICGGVVWTNSATLDLDKWYRLTVKQYIQEDEEENQVLYGEVRLNGTKIYPEGDAKALLNDQSGTLKQIAFQGTGAIDELVVTDVDPFTSSAILITLTGDTGVTFTTGGVSVASGTAILSGTEVAVGIADWYEVASITADGITAAPADAIAVGSKVSTNVTLTASAAASYTLTGRKYTSADPDVSFGNGASASANLVADWATKYGVTAAAVKANANNEFNCFLYNVSANNICALSIGSISVSGTKATITLTAKVNGTAVELSTLTVNGKLNIKLFDTLGGTPTEKSISINQASGTTTIDMGTAKFIQAEVNAAAADVVAAE